MIRAVLDTNVLVSALIVKSGKPAQILRCTDRFQMLISQAIVDEVRDVMSRRRIRSKYLLTDDDVQEFITRLESISDIVTIQRVEEVITNDPPDNLVLACAVEGKADYLVSGNEHFLRLDRHQQVEMISPAQFLDLVLSFGKTNAR